MQGIGIEPWKIQSLDWQLDNLEKKFFGQCPFWKVFGNLTVAAKLQRLDVAVKKSQLSRRKKRLQKQKGESPASFCQLKRLLKSRWSQYFWLPEGRVQILVPAKNFLVKIKCSCCGIWTL